VQDFNRKLTESKNRKKTTQFELQVSVCLEKPEEPKIKKKISPACNSL